MSKILETILARRIVPVVVLKDASRAEALGEALVAGGLPIAEVTFRTAAAEDAIRVLAKRSDLLVGAGTVIRPDQVDRAVDAGAHFIVSPGLSAAVVRRAQERGVPVLPGVATPTEIISALDLGVDVLKFFPAETSGGVAAVKALAAPFPGVRFVPTGGIGAGQLASYLSVPAVAAVGGSWMVSSSLVDTGNFDEITRLTAEAVTLATSS